METRLSPSFQAQYLLEIVQDQKQGIPRGIYSVCSTHPDVLAACMRQAQAEQLPLLVEATCNQVNQFGGYTGMTPQDMIAALGAIARRQGFPLDRLILGGDHLGPSPWQAESIEIALGNAHKLVEDFVRAGFTKIHLDASMRLAGDPVDQPLPPEVAAARTAALCLTAESAALEMNMPVQPLYIIGSEVPLPGGSQEHEDTLSVTSVEDTQRTIHLTQEAFQALSLDLAWERVIGLVVQPGVEFGSDYIIDYDRTKAHQLSTFIESNPQLIFEAHSTDYQHCHALKELVADHFAILKVGPGLTFAFREAVLALAAIEQEWLAHRSEITLSGILDALEQVMQDDPRYWLKYYRGDENDLAISRKYSFSDRIRYYWPDREIQQALARLLHNLDRFPPPLPLISQYLPVQYRHLRSGTVTNHPQELIWDHIQEVAACYSQACQASDR